MKVVIMVCTKKKFFQDKWVILGPKMAHPHNSGSALRIFFKFCTMKRANRHMEILLVFFRGKIPFGVIWSFRLFFTVLLGTVEIEPDHCYYWILDSQNLIRILKQSRHFSGKHLCDRCCMDIMGCLCVEVKIKQRVIWFNKASLRICYVSLFDCKDPWMLKTDSLIFQGNLKYFAARQSLWCCVEKIW